MKARKLFFFIIAILLYCLMALRQAKEVQYNWVDKCPRSCSLQKLLVTAVVLFGIVVQLVI